MNIKDITTGDVEWIINDNGELGIKIGDRFFFLYKGHSLVYEDGKHDDGKQIKWRLVGKREFGESCHPYKMDGLTAEQYFRGPGYAADEHWHDLPPNPQDQRAGASPAPMHPVVGRDCYKCEDSTQCHPDCPHRTRMPFPEYLKGG